ncbi:MAG: hypothetical protein ACOYYS_12210 [Chloroflexota bacterium]
MLFSILLLAVIVFLSWKAAPREKAEDAHVHGAGQVGLLAALALFGVDYFTSFYYATGEMMHALHPYGLQRYAYFAVAVIALANVVFGALYMYSLGVFREGGGSFAAAMRYLGPSISLVVAVVLVQDYIFTIVVSTLSGSDQLLSVIGEYNSGWFWHFLIGAILASFTYFFTIRGRGESAQLVFTLIGVFALMTTTMFIGLVTAQGGGAAAADAAEPVKNVSLLEALYHMLAASMKGLVALTGLEAMSDGIQFVVDEDAAIVRWGKKRLPSLKKLWSFYSGKPGIGRFVQTSFLFYGGLTTLALTFFSLKFHVFDGTDGRTLVGNLAVIGFGQFPGGDLLFWVYQFLAVGLLAAASMTAYQDLQAITWRNVAIGEIPEIVVYRNPKGTFTRPVTAAFVTAVIVQFLVRGDTSTAVPYYGVGVFLPITAMGLAIRRHISLNYTGKARAWGLAAATFSTVLSALIFVGQVVGKWSEGGWVVLLVLIFLVLIAHAVLLSPTGYRTQEDIRRIIRDKSRVEGPMGDMVTWQSQRTQEYRYQLMIKVAQFAELFGIRRPMRFEPPVPAGDYDAVMAAARNSHTPQTLQEQYDANQPKPEPRLGGKPSETGSGSEPDQQP